MSKLAMMIPRKILRIVSNIFPASFKMNLENELGICSPKNALYRLKKIGINPELVIDAGAFNGIWTKNYSSLFPNETEVESGLKSYGFKTYLLEKMSLREQVILFAQAKIVIAPHGAGLTNLIFSQPAREALHNLLELSQSLLLQGQSTQQVLEVMMPS
jgi:hypothetical protein